MGDQSKRGTEAERQRKNMHTNSVSALKLLPGILMVIMLTSCAEVIKICEDFYCKLGRQQCKFSFRDAYRVADITTVGLRE